MGSKELAAAAIRITLTTDMEVEKEFQRRMAKDNVKVAAVNYGGDFIASINKIIERAVVAAKREGLISATMGEEGAVAGATREAVSQIMDKAIGLNVGGKIGIARYENQICVCLFFGIGLLNMNDICIGLSHRSM